MTSAGCARHNGLQRTRTHNLFEEVPGHLNEGVQITQSGGVVGPQLDARRALQRLGQLDDRQRAGFASGIDQEG